MCCLKTLISKLQSYLTLPVPGPVSRLHCLRGTKHGFCCDDDRMENGKKNARSNVVMSCLTLLLLETTDRHRGNNKIVSPLEQISWQWRKDRLGRTLQCNGWDSFIRDIWILTCHKLHLRIIFQSTSDKTIICCKWKWYEVSMALKQIATWF